MTPSKESLQAAHVILRADDWKFHLGLKEDIATLIDTAYAEHRERVRRLVVIAERAHDELASLGMAFEEALHRNATQSILSAEEQIDEIRDEMSAALAPFLEQETT